MDTLLILVGAWLALIVVVVVAWHQVMKRATTGSHTGRPFPVAPDRLRSSRQPHAGLSGSP